MPADLVLFNHTCLLVHWKSKTKATWPIPIHQTCQLTLWNFISQGCYIVNTKYMLCWELCRCSCNIYACPPSDTATNTTAVQTCLPVECCCIMNACWIMATQSAFLPTVYHSILPLILLVWCLTISRVCWYGVLQYRPCILVWCLTISRACWCSVSL